jgi:hypothetical protein
MHVVDEQIAAHAELLQLYLLRAKHLARPVDGVVLGMVEVEVVIQIHADLGREVLGAKRTIDGAGVAVEPAPVGIGKRSYVIDGRRRGGSRWRRLLRGCRGGNRGDGRRDRRHGRTQRLGVAIVGVDRRGWGVVCFLKRVQLRPQLGDFAPQVGYILQKLRIAALLRPQRANLAAHLLNDTEQRGVVSRRGIFCRGAACSRTRAVDSRARRCCARSGLDRGRSRRARGEHPACGGRALLCARAKTHEYKTGPECCRSNSAGGPSH